MGMGISFQNRSSKLNKFHALFSRLACHGKTVAEAIRKTDGPRYRLADLRYDMKVGDVGSLADAVRTVLYVLPITIYM